MCTTCSKCVADVYVGIKTHLCNTHTRPCTVYICKYECARVHIHVHLYIHRCITIPMYIYIYIYIHIFIYTYIHICMHTHTHTHLHTRRDTYIHKHRHTKLITYLHFRVTWPARTRTGSNIWPAPTRSIGVPFLCIWYTNNVIRSKSTSAGVYAYVFVCACFCPSLYGCLLLMSTCAFVFISAYLSVCMYCVHAPYMCMHTNKYMCISSAMHTCNVNCAWSRHTCFSFAHFWSSRSFVSKPESRSSASDRR